MFLSSPTPSRAQMPSSSPYRGCPQPMPVEGFTADLPGVSDVKERPEGVPSVGHRMPNHYLYQM